MFASYKDGGQTKRWRGNAEDFAKEVPQNAEGLQASFVQSRMEVFVTAGKPTKETLKITRRRSRACARRRTPNDLNVGSTRPSR